MDEAAILSTGFCSLEQLKIARKPTKRFFSVSRPAGQIAPAESNVDLDAIL